MSESISVVIPIFGQQSVLEPLASRLGQTLAQLTDTHEIILVNDGSPDQSWEVIKRLAKNNPRIKGINLSRNFGQHHAISAGLDHAQGDWVVVMDGDLQDQPEEIAKLYSGVKKGFDMALAKRKERQDTLRKKISSKLFYFVFNFLSNASMNNKVANFGIYSKDVIQQIVRMKEQTRFFPAFINWVGFSKVYVDVNHSQSDGGKSTYNLKKLIRLAEISILSYSDKPIRLTVQMGLSLSFLSILGGVYFICRKLFLGVPITGWTSLMVSLYFIGGLILFNIGVLGLYIGRIFEETKNRPLYLIKDRVNI